MQVPRIVLHDELIVDHALDTEIVIDGRRHKSVCVLDCKPIHIDGDIRPSLILGVRPYFDEAGSLRLSLPLTEPRFEKKPGCVVIFRRKREVELSGNLALVWAIFRVMDGALTVNELLAHLSDYDSNALMDLLAGLAYVGAIDVSNRAISHFIHSRTKKGVLAGGGLCHDEVLHLVTDCSYRSYADKERISLGSDISESLMPLHSILARRRSFRDYNGAEIDLGELAAIIKTACGITGALKWMGREVKLRAYPSSGGLYSVEIYPIVFAVRGLATGIYHYCPDENILEVVQPNMRREYIVDASLPSEREMIAGTAVMICLTGVFSRHERKYGEGGYRMMVAEAGHISQNLILAATALGLDAKPFGGVFDDLLHKAMDLDVAQEQFLLSVIMGHAGAI